MRGGYFTFKTNYIEPFPVPKTIDKAFSLKISNLVDQILNNTKNGNKKSNLELEKEIDLLLFGIYNLSEEQIGYISENINLNKA